MSLDTQRQIRDILDRLERLEKPDAGGVVVAYTPTYVGGTTAGATTYSVQQGAYIRLGKAILWTCTVTWTNATGTGTARISLPFTASSTANQNFAPGLLVSGVTFAAGTPQAFIAPATAYFTMLSPATNVGSTNVNVEVAGTIVASGVFFVD